MDYFREEYPQSWGPGYLQQRLREPFLDTPPDAPDRVGLAPAGWTTLTRHLHEHGFTDTELLAAGLATRTADGRVIDRFRDRLIFPIRHRTPDGELEIVGFTARRNPDHDTGQTADRTPKYLNTPTTELYTKGEHLYGLAEHHDLLADNGVAVIVEGPLDALAIDLATGGTMAGVAPLGTALTPAHAAQLRTALGPMSDRIIVALDPDDAGQAAARTTYRHLTDQLLDPRAITLPGRLDPAETLRALGPDTLAELLATAEPMSRQLIAATLAGHDLKWPEHRVAAARAAAMVIAASPPATWPQEIAAIAASTGLDESILRHTTINAHTDRFEHPVDIVRLPSSHAPSRASSNSLPERPAGFGSAARPRQGSAR